MANPSIKKKQVMAYLEPAQHKALKALSKKTGITISEYLRKGVNMVLKKHKGTKK